MNRRGFLRSLLVAPIAARAVAPFMPKPAPLGLAFSRDAFAFMCEDLPTPNVWTDRRLVDKELGLSIRFVQHYDIAPDINPARWDWVIPTVPPEFCGTIDHAGRLRKPD